jgi:hypothetical protein
MDEVYAWHKQVIAVYVHHCRGDNDIEIDNL